MDTKGLNSLLCEIVDQIILLDGMTYEDEKYDDEEEKLHDLEDKLVDEYGEVIEEIMDDVHVDNAIDSDVLSPIAYLAKKYQKEGENYNVDVTEGVYVSLDAYPTVDTRLVLLPNPLRVLMNVAGIKGKILWEA